MQQLRPQVDAIGGVFTHMRSGAGAHEVDVADAGHNVWLRVRLGNRFVTGFFAHAGAVAYELVDRIWALLITDV